METIKGTDYRIEQLEREILRLKAVINTPEIDDFLQGVRLEAAHQEERWGSTDDGGKSPIDWFWLLGYLGGKCLAACLAGDIRRAKHHTISSAAMLFNWHRRIEGKGTMRPGTAYREIQKS